MHVCRRIAVSMMAWIRSVATFSDSSANQLLILRGDMWECVPHGAVQQAQPHLNDPHEVSTELVSPATLGHETQQTSDICYFALMFGSQGSCLLNRQWALL